MEHQDKSDKLNTKSKGRFKAIEIDDLTYLIDCECPECAADPGAGIFLTEGILDLGSTGSQEFDTGVAEIREGCADLFVRGAKSFPTCRQQRTYIVSQLNDILHRISKK